MVKANQHSHMHSKQNTSRNLSHSYKDAPLSMPPLHCSQMKPITLLLSAWEVFGQRLEAARSKWGTQGRRGEGSVHLICESLCQANADTSSWWSKSLPSSRATARGKEKTVKEKQLVKGEMAEGIVNVHGVEFTRRDGVGDRCEVFS